MTCINCDKTDGQCYTSLPPKVRCTVTGKFHLYDDPCDVQFEPVIEKVTLKNATEYAQYAKSAFPDNAVLALPDYISLHSCSKDVLENYIGLIASVIDKEL